MRYLGIDYGAKRIGLALSDRDGGFAFPHATIQNTATALAEIMMVIEKEKVEGIVMGDTRASSNVANSITEQAEQFMADLEEKSGLVVRRVPELHSSIEASRYAPETSTHDDAAAAAILLQRFIEMHEGDVE